MNAHLSSSPSAAGLALPLLLATDQRAGRITVTGDLDRDSAHLLSRAVATLALGDQRTWTVDAAGITFCDAAGLRVLANARALARSRGAVLVVDGPARWLLELLDLVGMGQPLHRPLTAV